MSETTKKIPTPKALLCIGVLLFVGVWIVIEVFFAPRLRVRVKRGLVGPEHEVISMLSDAPLEDIKKAFAEIGEGMDDYSWSGESLLYHAVMDRRLDVVEWMLSEGANPNGLHPSRTPLMMAIAQDDVEMVKLLIERGADPDLQYPDGWTARRSIIELHNYPEMIDALRAGEEARAKKQAEEEKARESEQKEAEKGFAPRSLAEGDD